LSPYGSVALALVDELAWALALVASIEAVGCKWGPLGRSVVARFICINKINVEDIDLPFPVDSVVVRISSDWKTPGCRLVRIVKALFALER
jgi:hypothetical protein